MRYVRVPLWRALHTRKANMTRGLKGLVELLSLYFRGFTPVEFVRGDDRITQHASGWRVNGSGHLERAKDAVAYLEQAPAEEWRQVYCGINLFLVSDRGNVKKHDGTPAETFILNGRCQIKYQIVKFGRLRNREIYRSHLVAMAFLNYQRGDEREIHHINGYRMDDSVANLVVLSREDHAKVHGYGATAPTGPVEKDMPLPKQRTRKGAKPSRGKHAGAPAGLSYALETAPEVPLVGVPSVEEEGEPQAVEATARECAPKRRRRKSSAKRHAEQRGAEVRADEAQVQPEEARALPDAFRAGQDADAKPEGLVAQAAISEGASSSIVASESVEDFEVPSPSVERTVGEASEFEAASSAREEDEASGVQDGAAEETGDGEAETAACPPGAESEEKPRASRRRRRGGRRHRRKEGAAEGALEGGEREALSEAPSPESTEAASFVPSSEHADVSSKAPEAPDAAIPAQDEACAEESARHALCASITTLVSDIPSEQDDERKGAESDLRSERTEHSEKDAEVWDVRRAAFDAALGRLLSCFDETERAEGAGSEDRGACVKETYRALRPFHRSDDPVLIFDTALSGVRRINHFATERDERVPGMVAGVLSQAYQLLKGACRSLAEADEVSRSCAAELLEEEAASALYLRLDYAQKLRACARLLTEQARDSDSKLVKEPEDESGAECTIDQHAVGESSREALPAEEGDALGRKQEEEDKTFETAESSDALLASCDDSRASSAEDAAALNEDAESPERESVGKPVRSRKQRRRRRRPAEQQSSGEETGEQVEDSASDARKDPGQENAGENSSLHDGMPLRAQCADASSGIVEGKSMLPSQGGPTSLEATAEAENEAACASMLKASSDAIAREDDEAAAESVRTARRRRRRPGKRERARRRISETPNER